MRTPDWLVYVALIASNFCTYLITDWCVRCQMVWQQVRP